MPQFFGICGRNPRPCTMAWASDNNSRVGSYPSTLLPSRRTIWHASAQGGYSFRPPIVNPGETFGLPSLGFFTPTGVLSIQFDNFTPSTRIVLSFSKTANRLNVTHILTEKEIASVDPLTGIGEIDVGEYIFDAIAVTDQFEVLDQTLTEEEKNQIKNQESESDRIFRKLFEQGIPNSRNRLEGVRVNLEGIEYRFDNGSNKAISALDDTGFGFFVGSGAAKDYRDGSSRILKVNLTKLTERLQTQSETDPNSLQFISRKPKVGDTVYLSYVAVKEHYIRQSVNIKWSMYATSLPSQCFSFATSIKTVSFRFFEWSNIDKNNKTYKLAGWRAVEADNVPVNFISFLGLAKVDDFGGAQLSDCMIGNPTNGINNFQYLPSIISYEDLQSIILNKNYFSYNVNLNQSLGGESFRINQGVNLQQRAYTNANWYKNNLFSFYNTPSKAREKVLFNVHSKSLRKRDVDKFAIESTLAHTVRNDIKSGRISYIPFMDDYLVDEPTKNNKSYLDNSNFEIKPIETESKWSIGNTEIECAVGGGIALGFNSGFNGFGDVMGVFGVISPVITERFEKETRILVEKFATQGEFGPNIVAIEGAATGTKQSVTCIDAKNQQNAYAAHTNQDDNLILFNKFETENVFDGLRSLEFRPDLGTNKTEETNINDKNKNNFSGLLGFNHTNSPGTTLSVHHLLNSNNFQYYSNDINKAKQKINSDKIYLINISKTNNIFNIALPIGYYGHIFIEYQTEKDVNFSVLLKEDGSTKSIIDKISFNKNGSNILLNCKWYKINNIDIITDNSENLLIKNIIITGINGLICHDFLNEEVSTVAKTDFYDKSLFFETDVLSISTDEKDNLYIFFNDKDNGISCLISKDNGLTWVFHYGVIEQLSGNSSQNPFAIRSNLENTISVFYTYKNKILCKSIPCGLFLHEDSMIIERYETDRLVTENRSIPLEKQGLFSDKGRELRRQVLSYIAAGDMSDRDFLNILGKNPDTGTDQPNALLMVQNGDNEFQVDSKKVPITIGSTTAFEREDIEDIYFSAFKDERGKLHLFYLAEAEESIGGGLQLQCHFSNDNGITWYNLWEFIENNYSRLKIDHDSKTSFIDWNNQYTDKISGKDTLSPELAKFGINLHWSRLPEDKVNNSNDSKVIEIQSPYVFYHEFLNQMFIYYVYKGCLLCKIIDHSLLKKQSDRNMLFIKESIEEKTRSYFIDGDISKVSNELHYLNDQGNIQKNGNIIYRQIGSTTFFDSKRNISPQRVCAYRFSNCNIRVFYKTDNSNYLKAATWNGSDFFVEEVMHGLNKPIPNI